MPEDLTIQMEWIKNVVRAFNIPVFQESGYEADDIIATLSREAVKAGLDVKIITNDKDAMQLIDGRVSVLSLSSKQNKEYDKDLVREKFGVRPEMIVDFLALTGDASDNVPGVKGIGKVSASKLLNKYGSIDKIYENLQNISETMRKKLEQGKDSAELSRDLVRLDEDVPVAVDLTKSVMGDPDREKLAELFEELEFNRLLKEFSDTGDFKTELRIMDDDDLAELRNDLNRNREAVYYLIRASRDEIEGICFCVDQQNCVYVPFDCGNPGRNTLAILEDKNIRKVSYDIKEDMHSLERSGIKYENAYFDVMIADYLIDPSRAQRDLLTLTITHLGHGVGVDKEAEAGSSGSYDNHLKAAYSASAIFRLYHHLSEILRERSLEDLFSKVEMPLVKVLYFMESCGVGIDKGFLSRMSVKIDKELSSLTDQIYKCAGEEFNLNSPLQLRKVLFEKLELPVIKRTKTGPSTDESVLRRLAGSHELPELMLQYRELNKLKTGYYDSLLKLAGKGGKIHTRFNQTVTATGRLSSSDPNLQNIPVKTETGRAIRKAFMPGKEGDLLLSADYSQIELRVLAHLSSDKKLIEAFVNDEDIHSYTASLIFDVPLKDVDPGKRSIAKTVNFGIVYGISPYGLARDLDIGIKEAGEFIEAYFARYPGIKVFMDETMVSARRDGYVKTLLNRVRYIPEIRSSNERIRSFAERMAVNTPVQGSAADLIKIAMIDCCDAFSGSDIRMILQVHDELVFEVPHSAIDETAEKVKSIMEGVMSLKVPLKVDLKSGTNWLEMERFSIAV
jgi:DNA polymerase-1